MKGRVRIISAEGSSASEDSGGTPPAPAPTPTTRRPRRPPPAPAEDRTVSNRAVADDADEVVELGIRASQRQAEALRERREARDRALERVWSRDEPPPLRYAPHPRSAFGLVKRLAAPFLYWPGNIHCDFAAGRPVEWFLDQPGRCSIEDLVYHGVDMDDIVACTDWTLDDLARFPDCCMPRLFDLHFRVRHMVRHPDVFPMARLRAMGLDANMLTARMGWTCADVDGRVFTAQTMSRLGFDAQHLIDAHLWRNAHQWYDALGDAAEGMDFDEPALAGLRLCHEVAASAMSGRPVDMGRVREIAAPLVRPGGEQRFLELRLPTHVVQIVGIAYDDNDDESEAYQ